MGNSDVGRSRSLDRAGWRYQEKYRGDHRRQSIEDFRNKQIAHSGQTQISPPIINDIFALHRSTAEPSGC